MKTFKPFLMSLTIASLSLFAAGCNDEEDRQEAFSQQQLQHGSYVSERCFLNKISTQTSTGDRFSTADLTFNPDGTGSGNFRIFSDNTCTTQVGSEAFTFSEVAVESIGGVNVIRLKQSGSVINPTWRVPFNLSDGGYSFDVDFTDGESGPYILEPTPTELSSFGQNPGQGVAFRKQ